MNQGNCTTHPGQIFDILRSIGKGSLECNERRHSRHERSNKIDQYWIEDKLPVLGQQPRRGSSWSLSYCQDQWGLFVASFSVPCSCLSFTLCVSMQERIGTHHHRQSHQASTHVCRLQSSFRSFLVGLVKHWGRLRWSKQEKQTQHRSVLIHPFVTHYLPNSSGRRLGLVKNNIPPQDTRQAVRTMEKLINTWTACSASAKSVMVRRALYNTQ